MLDHMTVDLPPKLPLDSIRKGEGGVGLSEGEWRGERAAGEDARARVGTSFQYSRAIREARAAVLAGKLASYMGRGKENSSASPLPPALPLSLFAHAPTSRPPSSRLGRPPSSSAQRDHAPRGRHDHVVGVAEGAPLTARSMLVSPRPSSAREREKTTSVLSAYQDQLPLAPASRPPPRMFSGGSGGIGILLPPARDATPSPPHSAPHQLGQALAGEGGHLCGEGDAFPPSGRSRVASGYMLSKKRITAALGHVGGVRVGRSVSGDWRGGGSPVRAGRGEVVSSGVSSRSESVVSGRLKVSASCDEDEDEGRKEEGDEDGEEDEDEEDEESAASRPPPPRPPSSGVGSGGHLGCCARPGQAVAGPKVTCKSWAIFDCDLGEVVGGMRQDTKRPPASLTKIMTAWVVLKLCKIDPGLLSEKVSVTERASSVIGTTAELSRGETVTVLDALYGLLLPSGNDAAVALSEHFGKRLYARRAIRKARVAAVRAKKAQMQMNRLEATGHTKEEAAAAYLKKIKKREFDPKSAFVAEMNREAAAMGLVSTHFSNPHGMHAKNHHSTARDLVLLSWIAMASSDLFREIVRTKEHVCSVGIAGGATRTAKWDNTNALLKEEGYEGVKTGNTPMAKFCLSSQYRDPVSGRSIITVVLGSKTKEKRSGDTRTLVEWAMTNTKP